MMTAQNSLDANCALAVDGRLSAVVALAAAIVEDRLLIWVRAMSVMALVGVGMMPIPERI